MDNTLKELSQLFDCQYINPEKNSGFHRIIVNPKDCKNLLEMLLRDARFWCDQLISISGLHKPGPPQILQVHYHLASIPTGLQVQVWTEKTLEHSAESLTFESVSALWKSANWHERETGELFGIQFNGHPDQRNLLLPANWVGFPLRKDYQPQEEFHGIKIKYQKD
jgi:NADH-quinone oxidoreductase subunit C